MKINYRPEIDGLRAIAVVAVILYHLQITIFNHPIFKGGFIGVDIFFVISGYLITSIILKELLTTGTFSFKNFYQRRIRRILPALLFVMLVCLPFAWIYLLPIVFIDLSKSILYSLSFTSNFYFHYSEQQYGAISGLLKPFLHTWSLSVEEQYYILFPIILFIIFKFFKKYLLTILVIGFIISLQMADWGSRHYTSATFYFLHTRMFELIAGSILAYFEIQLGHRSKNQILNLILPSVGLFLIGHSLFFFNDKIFSPTFYTLSPIIGVSLIIWFSHKDELVTKILSSKLFVGIGLISYSLYLWHYPIFAFSRIIFEVTPINIFEKLAIGPIIIFLSIFSYFFIERPARNRKFKFKFILIPVILSYFILIITNFIVINNDGFQSRVHPYFKLTFQERSDLALNYNYGDFDERENIFIIGNSYAEDLLKSFYYNKELNKKFYFYVASKKNILFPEKNYQIKCFLEFLKNNTTLCEKEDFTSHLIKQYQNSDYIILSQRNNKIYLDKTISEIAKYLNKDNKKFLVLLNDVNGEYKSGMLQIDKFIHFFNKIPKNNELEFLEKQFYDDGMKYQSQDLIEIKKQFAKNNIIFMNRSEIFCDHISQKCQLLTLDNERIRADAGHLTDVGAKFFSKNLVKLIQKFN